MLLFSYHRYSSCPRLVGFRRTYFCKHPVQSFSPTISCIYVMSEKRISANKRNALRSTGPRTQRGKARSKQNATKHGGYARVCSDGEDCGRMKALFLDLVTEYGPVGFEEELLISEIAETIWRKNRFKVAEAKVIAAYSYANFGKEEQ